MRLPAFYAVLLVLGAMPAASNGDEPVHVLRSGPGAGHFLVWRGKPVLPCGDSVTQGWMECGADFDQTAYVEALASRGVNLLMLWSYKGTNAARQRGDARLGYDAPETWPWMGSPDDRSFDLRRFNPVYFQRLRQLVGEAERRGVLVLITVHDGWTKTCFDGHPFNRALGNGPLADRGQYVELADYGREMPETMDPAWGRAEKNQYFQERFCARLISELKPFSNVLYEMFNEGEWYNADRRRRHERHFLAFFRDRCANPLVSNSDHIRDDRPHDEANLDVVSLHARGWTGHFGKFADGFRAAPAKPYLYSEPVPEFDGREPSLDVVRQSAWETLLAGAGWVNQNDTSFGWDRRAAMAARSEARDRAYDAAGHCARFFNGSDVRFWEMAPHGGLSNTGVCMARPGVEYVVYSPRGGPLTVNLADAAGATLRVRWLDPRSGKLHSSPDIAGGRAAQEFTPPFSGDCVLHLKRREPQSALFDSRLLPGVLPRSKRTFPPTIVYRTSACGISASGTVMMSFERTAMSASLPGVSEPLSCSSNPA